MTGEQEALALCAIGEDAIKCRDWPKAEASFERAIGADVTCVRGWIGAARCHRESMEYEAAEKRCRSALELDSNSLPVWIELSEIFGEQCKWPETEDACNMALALQPNCAKAMANLAVVRSSKGRVNEALSLLERSYELDATVVDARCTMGWIRLKEGAYDAAMASANIALSLEPADDGVHHLIASINHARGDNRTAANSYDTAASLATRTATRYVYLISASTLREDYWKAVEQYKFLIALLPTKANYQSRLGALYYNLGHLDDAQKSVRSAISLDPSDADAHYVLGCIYIRRGERDDAVQEIRTLRRLNPSWADKLYGAIIPWEQKRTRDLGISFMVGWTSLGAIAELPSGLMLVHPLYLCLGAAIFVYFCLRYVQLKRIARESSSELSGGTQ